MGLGYALAPGGYAGRDSDKGESRAPYKRKGNRCYLCCFVRIDMMDLLPRLELASATLGYEAPGSRRGDGGELQLVLALYLARTITRRILRCPTHKKNCDLLNAGAYLSQILFSLFRHTRGVRSKSSRALRLKLQHSHSLVARCSTTSLWLAPISKGAYALHSLSFSSGFFIL